MGVGGVQPASRVVAHRTAARAGVVNAVPAGRRGRFMGWVPLSGGQSDTTQGTGSTPSGKSVDNSQHGWLVPGLGGFSRSRRPIVNDRGCGQPLAGWAVRPRAVGCVDARRPRRHPTESPWTTLRRHRRHRRRRLVKLTPRSVPRPTTPLRRVVLPRSRGHGSATRSVMCGVALVVVGIVGGGGAPGWGRRVVVVGCGVVRGC